MTERSQRLSALQNGVVGSVAGMVEVLIQQPTVAMKNAIQQHRPIPWSVPALYRGVGVSLASIAPVSAVQFAVNGKMLGLLHQDPKKPTSDQVKITSAAVAGCFSSLLSSPAELVMTLQQNTGKSLVGTVRDVVQQHGVTRLFRGLEVTMMREAVWCASYLALGPVITQRLHTTSPGVFGSPEEASISQKASASAVGSILAGLVTVYATQPLDTIKTVMQGEALSVRGQNATLAWGTAKRMYHNAGGSLAPFYRGAVPRGARLIGAVFILGKAREYLEELIDERGILQGV
ncbi:hypothetical protein Poli38472_012885 [Pythium oligandrum]|uniref:Mitochondrial carrier protein n=1 Tax=Pythium oligandrum TaxID=41045 RepID=A0A8K1CJU7_PYTOL|nr:hypothetical protein Poli38472_012885 [Pythium oligandrum]|eukprot:TMW64263.1 hypothetical protein Poli38472_012885 [Pythium oligandrum]